MILTEMRFMKMSCCGFVLLCIGYTGLAHAEIYKSVDSEGHVTYSSSPSRGAKKLGLDPPSSPAYSSREITIHSARARDYVSPSDFPKVDSSTQKSRDMTRRKILSDELATEEKLLSEARANLKQGENALSDGKLHALQDEVTLHEKNVSALNTELSHVK